MTTFIIILLIILLILVSLKLFYIKHDMKNMIKILHENKNDYNQIKVESMDNDINELATCINSFYDYTNVKISEYKNSERRIKSNISNMTHDLRTPLTSIMGYIQIMEDEDLKNEEKDRYLSIIEKRTKSLNDLINCFYDLSRIEDDEFTMKMEYVNVSQILCDVVAEFYDDFIQKGIKPNITIDEHCELVIGDKSSITRVIINLINNMLKYAEKTVKISFRRSKNCLKLIFINEAQNIKEDEVEKLFDRFYTGDTSRSDKNTGLGLYIAKSLLEKMNHSICAKVEEGKLIIEITFRLQ